MKDSLPRTSVRTVIASAVLRAWDVVCDAGYQNFGDATWLALFDETEQDLEGRGFSLNEHDVTQLKQLVDTVMKYSSPYDVYKFGGEK